MERVSLFIAFGAGILSFFSPCILPLIPSYIGFITGLSVDELRGDEGQDRTRQNLRKILWQTILFIFGFSFIFVALGATAGFFGDIISAHEKIIRVVGGSVIIVLGLHVAGVFNIKKLEYEKKLHLRSKPVGMFGSFAVGVVFAIGWTPCVGPVLAGILGLAGAEKTLSRGVVLLSSYSLGLGVPFLLTAMAMNVFLNLFGKIKKHFKVISIVSGLLLIAIGILIMVGWPHTI